MAKIFFQLSVVFLKVIILKNLYVNFAFKYSGNFTFTAVIAVFVFVICYGVGPGIYFAFCFNCADF